MTLHLKRIHGSDNGFSLIEMLVSLIILGVVGAIFTVSFVSIQNNYRKANGEVDAQTLARKAFTVLDTQVRYADTINDPVTLSNGSQYVEFESPCNATYSACSGANTGTDHLCTQWRVTTVGAMQWRQWLVRASATNTAVPASPIWNSVIYGLVTTGQPVFATPSADPAGAFAAIGEPPSVAVPSERQLSVTLTVASGNPPSQASSSSVFSAANSTTLNTSTASPSPSGSPGAGAGGSVSPPATVVCQQLGRQ